MTPRRTTPDTYMVGVKPEFGGVKPEPAQSRLAVMQLCGEEVLGCKAVVDADTKKPCESKREYMVRVFFSSDPSTPMNL